MIAGWKTCLLTFNLEENDPLIFQNYEKYIKIKKLLLKNYIFFIFWLPVQQ